MNTRTGPSEGKVRTQSVAILSNNDAIIADVTKIIESLPNHRAQTQKGTLSGMNGAAVTFATDNDLIIFETSPDSADDFSAVSNIRNQIDRGARLIALTTADISLTEARRLTRAGVDEVLTYPFDMTDLRGQIERWTQSNALVTVPEPLRGQTSKIITVARSRGGAGATLFAVNLAQQLMGQKAMFRKTVPSRVCLVDLDLQFGDVASFMDLKPRDALYHMASDGTLPDATFLRQSIITTKGGLDVLTAPARFAPLDSLSNAQIGALVTHLKGDYDYIVFDLPMAMVEWLSPVLESTDRLLMVTDSAVPSIAQARRMIDFYTTDHIGMSIEIVVNNEKKPMMRSSAHREAEKVLERPLKHWLPPDRKSARMSIDHGLSLAEVAKSAVLTKSIAAVAQTLIAEFATPSAATVARK